MFQELLPVEVIEADIPPARASLTGGIELHSTIYCP